MKKLAPLAQPVAFSACVMTPTAMAGSIPLQLVKAEPAMGQGAMQGVSYIQRLKTQGGVAPAAPCTAYTVGQKRQAAYPSDCVFYRAM